MGDNGVEASSQGEADRLAALERYKIMDTPNEAEFDDIARIAAQICGVPMALVSLLDDKRQWFKAKIGLDALETPRAWAFCDHAIKQPEVFEVGDASKDARFTDNPLVTGEPHLRFYAGAPLRTPEGLPIGTLCVLDRQPHELSIDQRAALEALGRQVMAQLELRRRRAQQQADDARHRLILASAVDYAIISMDLHGSVTSWNEGAHRVLGWTEDEMCGQQCDVFFTAEDRAEGQPAKEMGEALRTGYGTDERWHLRKDGECFWANGEMMPLNDDSGIPIGFIKILRDRTEQRLSRERLEGTERRYELALEAAELGAWEATPNLEEMDADARARNLLGQDAEGALDFRAAFINAARPEDRVQLATAVEQALKGGADNPLDIEFRVVRSSGQTATIHARGQLMDPPDRPARLIGTVRDVSERAAADAHRMLLTNELKHRIKNTLAVVQGIVSQSLRTVATPAEARQAIGERLAAMASAQDLLTQTSWSAAPMHAVVEDAVGVAGALSGRVRVSGPDFLLKPRSALALAMALHELTTNAIKYGALSNEAGHVDLGWQAEEHDPELHLVWQEVGGPPVGAPTRQGFGSKLIGTSLRSDLGGEGKSEYLKEGFRWSLSADRGRIEHR